MGNFFLNQRVSSFLWSEGMTWCWHAAILGGGKDEWALQALTRGGVHTYTLTHCHLVTGMQFGKGSSTAASLEGWTSAINHTCEVCWGGQGEFGLVLTGCGLVFQKYFGDNLLFPVIRGYKAITGLSGCTFRLKPFACIFTHSLHHFRHLYLLRCLWPILYLKVILDLKCSLSESYWIQWKWASEVEWKKWAPKICLDHIMAP